MDNRRNVSIRLNGKEKTYKLRRNQDTQQASDMSNHSISEEIAASREGEEETDWMSFDRLDHLEDEQEKKIVDLGTKRKERVERSLPFWDDGKRDKGPKLPPFGRKNKKPFRFSFNVLFHSLFLPIVAAIIVGGAFGFILLNVFTNNDTASYVNNNESTNLATNETQSGVENGDANSFSIPALQLYVVQEGAYSTMENGKEVVSGLRTNNIPAVLSENVDLVYLFMGVGSSEESAEGIANYFEENGKEAYVKPFGVSGQAELASEEWEQFLENGVVWMESAAALSAKKIAGETLNEEEIQNMLDAGKAWNESLETVKSTEESPEVISLAEEWVSEGQETLQAVESSVLPTSRAWDLQQTVLSMMLTYEELVSNF